MAPSTSQTPPLRTGWPSKLSAKEVIDCFVLYDKLGLAKDKRFPSRDARFAHASGGYVLKAATFSDARKRYTDDPQGATEAYHSGGLWETFARPRKIKIATSRKGKGKEGARKGKEADEDEEVIEVVEDGEEEGG